MNTESTLNELLLFINILKPIHLFLDYLFIWRIHCASSERPFRAFYQPSGWKSKPGNKAGKCKRTSKMED